MHGRLGEASGRLLEFNGNELLTGPGKISAEQAKLHAETEYEKYRIIQDRLYESCAVILSAFLLLCIINVGTYSRIFVLLN